MVFFAGEREAESGGFYAGSQNTGRAQVMSYPSYDWDYVTDIYTDSEGNTVILRSDGSSLVTSRLEHIAIACQAYTLNLPLIVNWVDINVWDAVAVMY
jgi:hypothetical protein